ncbi:MAG: hypothetical protein LBQ82_07070 [Treponema sp.]|jgi:hypothetical protein|nr:hypothetical protein [Treponema sp.]
MKNIIKSLIVIALAAVIGFSFVSCGGGDGDDTIPVKWLGTYQGVGIFETLDGNLFDCSAKVTIYNNDDYGGAFSFEFSDINNINTHYRGEGMANIKSGGTIAGDLAGEYVHIFCGDNRKLGILVNIPSERKVQAFFGAKMSEIILEYEQEGVTATPAISANGISTDIIYSFDGYKQY